MEQGLAQGSSLLAHRGHDDPSARPLEHQGEEVAEENSQPCSSPLGAPGTRAATPSASKARLPPLPVLPPFKKETGNLGARGEEGQVGTCSSKHTSNTGLP